jgi:hypothetical protein
MRKRMEAGQNERLNRRHCLSAVLAEGTAVYRSPYPTVAGKYRLWLKEMSRTVNTTHSRSHWEPESLFKSLLRK